MRTSKNKIIKNDNRVITINLGKGDKFVIDKGLTIVNKEMLSKLNDCNFFNKLIENGYIEFVKK